VFQICQHAPQVNINVLMDPVSFSSLCVVRIQSLFRN